MPATIAVVSAYYPPHLGGVELYVHQLVKHLASTQRYRVVVITAETDSGAETRSGMRAASAPNVGCGTGNSETGLQRYRHIDAETGAVVYCLPVAMTASNSPLHPVWPLLIREIFRHEKVDLVSAHSPVPGLADIALAVRGKRRAVLTYHASSLVKGVGGILDVALGAYERTVLRALVHNVDEVVCVAPGATPETFRDVTVISPGVDLERFCPGDQISQERSAGNGSFVVQFTGRIDASSRWKGVEVLLEAVAQASANTPNLVLRLVGDGDDLSRLLARAEALKISDKVISTGRADGESLVHYYRSADLQVLPSTSRAEGFGMVLAEAMACGTAAVGSNIGGIPHVLNAGRVGVLVPPGDVDALSATLIELASDPERVRELGLAGAKYACVNWSWSTQLNRYLDIFDKLMGDTTGP